WDFRGLTFLGRVHRTPPQELQPIPGSFCSDWVAKSTHRLRLPAAGLVIQPANGAGRRSTIKAYKLLSNAEPAFRSLKIIDIELRPFDHRHPDRVHVPVFSCMMAISGQLDG